MTLTAPASFGRQTILWGSSDGKPGTSDGSLDIDAFLDNMLNRDPIGLGTELVPPALAQGLGLCMDVLQGQQGSNGRKQGSGNRVAAALPRPGGNGGVSGSVPLSAAPKAAVGQRNAAEAGLRGNQGDQDDDDDIDVELALAQNQAAAAGAAAAQAAYAHQQQQAATAMAAAAQAYSHQQAAYAQQTQQAATAAAVCAAANQPAASNQRHFYHQAQQAQAQAQQAAYLQAYQQQAAAHQAQAAAYVAATGQYPPGWIPNPYAGQYTGQYYTTATPQQQYVAGPYSQGGGQQYQSNVTGTAAAAIAQQSAQQRQQQQQQAVVVAAAGIPTPVTAPTTGVAAAPLAGASPLLDPTGALAAAAAAATLVAVVDPTKFVDDGDDARAVKRPRLIWTQALHRRFLESVEKCGGLDHAHPKAIMKEMDVNGLTRENVASHMQKYRMRLKKEDGGGRVGVGGGGGGGDGDEEEEGDALLHGAEGEDDAVGAAATVVGNEKVQEETPRKNNAEGDGGDGEDAEDAVSKKAAVGSKRKAAFDTAQAANNSNGTAL
jgi:SHAQKYF class myb-like DNA-binding protein